VTRDTHIIIIIIIRDVTQISSVATLQVKVAVPSEILVPFCQATLWYVHDSYSLHITVRISDFTTKVIWNNSDYKNPANFQYAINSGVFVITCAVMCAMNSDICTCK
jgi:hypothetical protein